MIKTNIIIGNLFQGQNIIPYRVNNILTTKINETVPDNIRDIFKRKILRQHIILLKKMNI